MILRQVDASKRKPAEILKSFFAIDSKGKKGTAYLADPNIYYDGWKREWIWEGNIYKGDVAFWFEEIKRLPTWVRADSIDLDDITRPVLAKRIDDETIIGRGSFQKSDRTFFWFEQGFVPISKKDHDKLLLLDDTDEVEY